MVTGPLNGLRVLDFTRFVSGSYATMTLAALGADVVKVETAEGDPYRTVGPHGPEDETTLFRSLNTGKRSLVVDFRTAEGREVLERLLATCDFLVENSRPGSLERYGLDYASVHERFPRLIYGSVSGYGDVGPDAHKGGFDLVLQAESGLMSVTGDEACGPVKVGAPVLDVGAGLCCVVGMLAAHAQRADTGEGRQVRTSLFEFALASLSTVAAEYLATGTVPGLLGTHSPTFAPYGRFRTRDGWLILAGAGSEDMWRRACQVLGREELIDDERFCDNATRVRFRDELSAELESTLAGETTATWLERLGAAGVPASEIRGVGDVLEGDQVAALGVIQRYGLPGAGEYEVLGSPLRLDGGERAVPGPAPDLDADTDALLAELGFDRSAIEGLRARAVVGR